LRSRNTFQQWHRQELARLNANRKLHPVPYDEAFAASLAAISARRTYIEAACFSMEKPQL
jgi:hypothetical protein